MSVDMKALAAAAKAEREERRKSRRMAFEMIRAGFRQFRGPIEQTTVLPRVYKNLRKLVDKAFPL